MKKILFALTVIFCSLTFLLQAQTERKEPFVLKVQSDKFSTDDMGNFYLVQGNTLFKYDEKGKLLYSYSEKMLGEISSVDASNPLRVLLFFSDLSQIVILDNTLSKNASHISLEGIGYEQATLVCSSNNNGFWLYDNNSYSLIRMSNNLEKVAETPNIMQMIDSPLEPNILQEAGDKIYMNNPSKGIYIFDVFGSISKVVPIQNITSMQVEGNNIYYIKGGEMFIFNMINFTENKYEIPVTTLSQIRIEGKNLYVNFGNEIKVFK